jgi:hypothetical protein
MSDVAGRIFRERAHFDPVRIHGRLVGAASDLELFLRADGLLHDVVHSTRPVFARGVCGGLFLGWDPGVNAI